MKIEPCPFCREDLVTVSSWTKCSNWTNCGGCLAEGPLFKSEEQAIAAHNRLSRLVRAAEEWAKAVRFEEEATTGKQTEDRKGGK